MWFHVPGDATGLDTAVGDALEVLAESTPQDVDCVAEDLPDEPNPEVDATQFVAALVPVEAYDGAGGACPSCYAAKDETRFYGATPGTTDATPDRLVRRLAVH